MTVPALQRTPSQVRRTFDEVRVAHGTSWLISCGALVTALVFIFGYKPTLTAQLGTLPFWLITLVLLGLGMGALVTCPYLLGWSELEDARTYTVTWLLSMGNVMIGLFAYAGLWLLLHPGQYSRFWVVPLVLPALIAVHFLFRERPTPL